MRDAPADFAPTGTLHLLLEVLAYVVDEAAALGRGGRSLITLGPDGSISVADDGRGTDTRVNDLGAAVRKPIMSTKDLRFFDDPAPPLLPDGCARRGMSTVAALSDWLVHANHRREGSWQQRYEGGVPVTDLRPIPFRGVTGTVVHFLPSGHLRRTHEPMSSVLKMARESWPELSVTVVGVN